MILSFGNAASTDIYNGEDTRAARKALPKDLWPVAQRKLSLIATAAVLGDLRSPPSNHLEALKGDRKGQHSIRVNRQYRICFIWTDRGANHVEVTDYH